MSVLINGMKIPKNCMLCPLCVEEADPTNGEMCMITGKLMPPNNDERLDNCPLIEVPPHGRLIDADAVLALINDSTILPNLHKWIINSIISGEPTVIEAEE